MIEAFPNLPASKGGEKRGRGGTTIDGGGGKKRKGKGRTKRMRQVASRPSIAFFRSKGKKGKKKEDLRKKERP